MLLLYLMAYTRCSTMAVRETPLWKDNPAWMLQTWKLHILHKPLEKWGGKEGNRKIQGTQLPLYSINNGRSVKAGNHGIRSPPIPTRHLGMTFGERTVRPCRGSLCVSDRCWWCTLEWEHRGWRAWCLPKARALTTSDWSGKNLHANINFAGIALAVEKLCIKLSHTIKLGDLWKWEM